ncbi:MAG: PAS domain S-box protein [Thermodesulfovibrionales bacterium]|nr:PAS domain S-box protein [Thermodesulfovibrionales bacterium]
MRAKILCVDDDPELLFINSSLLRHAGHEVLEASNGREGLSLVRKEHPDLILLDVMLPDINGIDICRQIKADPDLAGTYVMLISGMEISSEKQAYGLDEGADGYIVRPVSGHELLSRIQAMIRIKDAETALRKSKDSYQMLIDTMNEGLGVLNEKGFITFVNNKTCELVGHSQEEMIGRHVFEFLDEENRAKMQKQLNRRTKGDSGSYEVVWTKKNGQKIHTVVSPQPIFDAQGLFKGSFAVLTDITEQKRIQRELEQNLYQKRLILESVGEGIYGVDKDGNTIFVNPELLFMTGYDDYELLGQNAHFILRHSRTDGTPYDRETCPILDTLRNGLIYKVGDEVLWRKDGTRLPVEYTSAPILEEGNVIGAVVVVRDVTERTRAEEEIRKLNEELERRVVERTFQLEAVIKELESEIIERRNAEDKLQKYAEQLQVLSKRLIDVQEAERRYIAQELHDEVGQALTGVKLAIDMLIKVPSENTIACLGEVQDLVQELLGRVRNMSLDLRPSMLDDLGLLPALFWHFNRFTNQTNVKVRFKHEGLDMRFPSEIETAAYRIVQEALTNVARHACVNEASVFVAKNHQALVIKIADKGVGFDYETVLNARDTAGLRWMNERVLMLRGQMHIDSSPGNGTCLTARIPLKDSSSVISAQ